jgi:plastocyanin
VLLRVRIVNSSTTCASEFCFQPATPTIHASKTVQWVNRSTATHTVTRCSVAACGVSGGTGSTNNGFGSGDIGPGQSYRFTFAGTGTYVYYCTLHGYATMHGTITVTT